MTKRNKDWPLAPYTKGEKFRMIAMLVISVLEIAALIAVIITHPSADRIYFTVACVVGVFVLTWLVWYSINTDRGLRGIREQYHAPEFRPLPAPSVRLDKETER